MGDVGEEEEYDEKNLSEQMNQPIGFQKPGSR